MNPKLVLALVCVWAPCWAQTAPEAPAASASAPAAAPATERGEPTVKHTVIEDDGAKIDELRVRGQVQNEAACYMSQGGYYRRMGDYDRAFHHYDIALRLNGRHRGALSYMGVAYLHLDDVAQAAATLSASPLR